MWSRLVLFGALFESFLDTQNGALGGRNVCATAVLLCFTGFFTAWKSSRVAVLGAGNVENCVGEWSKSLPWCSTVDCPSTVRLAQFVFRTLFLVF